MNAYSDLARPLLFRLPPETAHRLTLASLRFPFIPRLLSGGVPAPEDPVELMGLKFRNRLGIAAGVDKNAEATLAWHELGFGFAELGTITLHAQPGNPKPRVFRFPSQQALINRLGFPNLGAEAIAGRLRPFRERHSLKNFPIGINLGKSKITPLHEASTDYLGSLRILHSLGDFFVINISSPNTPGLRDLAKPEDLRRLLSALQEYNRSQSSPDLEFSALPEIVQATREFSLSGIVATNTTLHRANGDPAENGGLSGRPLTDRALAITRAIRPLLSQGQVLIGVGGIMDATDYQARRDAGADLAQVYTGMVYLGPRTAWKILKPS
ncbi:MAG: quinone-dependent dihydroorotate dehydrogenase [Verrucomicrobia bacterium]|nr:quinone-dependent dihydroorotate dehydrogenase [Verrucomicrobiota bacterium]